MASSLIQNAWKETKLTHMALHLQMKTHPSSKAQNDHCHGIKKKLLGVSVFICVLSPSTQARKERTCVHFLDWIWGIQHSLQREKRIEDSLICYTILMLEVMDMMESSKVDLHIRPKPKTLLGILTDKKSNYMQMK